MKIDLPGYVPERRNGHIRHRVRVEGDKKRRITLPCGPDDPEFLNHYYAARAGEKLAAEKRQRAKPTPLTLRGVTEAYLTWLEAQVKGGNGSPLTLRQRRSVLRTAMSFKDENDHLTMGEYDYRLPLAALVHIQDKWGAATSQADTCTKGLRALYKWLMKRGKIDENPAMKLEFIHKSKGGAVPWSIDDVRAFMSCHEKGTPAFTWLMLAMFTGARREDLTLLGRDHEVTRDGIKWLVYQPAKKGSAPVEIPMMGPLQKAIAAQPVAGRTYLLNQYGRPFKTPDVLGRSVQKWTKAAGLESRSSHGLRKALAKILSEQGATQYQVMSVLAHTKAATSEVYTKSAERTRLARDAMSLLDGVNFG